MIFTKIKKSHKRIALALSLCLILLWVAMGTGATLAWFTDTSDEMTNIFHFGDFEVSLYHRLEDGTWEEVDGQTKVFDENALYEPGYTQIVYLKVVNTGDYAFDFKTAVSVTDYTVATNVYGWHFNLQDHLRFGIAVTETEEEMEQAVATRDLAQALATMKLSNYATELAALEPGQTAYLTLVVYMPESVGNEANYRGDTVPRVELGIIVEASQQKN